MTNATSDLSSTETGPGEPPLTLAEDLKGFALWLVTGPFVLTAGIFRALCPRRRAAKPAQPRDIPALALRASARQAEGAPSEAS